MKTIKAILVCVIGVVVTIQNVYALTLSVNSGDTYTTNQYTTLTLGSVPGDANWMIFSNDNSSWSSWESISSTKYNWDLTFYGGGYGDGSKMVYVKVFTSSRWAVK